MGCVYKITFHETGKIYVGATNPKSRKSQETNEEKLANRIWQHMNQTKGTQTVSREMQRVGRDGFRVEILHESDDLSTLIAKEAECIGILGSYDPLIGYNETHGGLGYGRPTKEVIMLKTRNQIGIPIHTEQHKRDLATKLKGNKYGTKNAKPVVCVETGQEFPRVTDAAKWAGAKCWRSPGLISEVLHGKRARAYGYTWRYVG